MHGTDEDCIIKIHLDDDDYSELRNPDNLKDYIRQHMTASDKQYFIFIYEAQFAISKEEIADKDKPIRLYGILKRNILF